MSVSVFDLFSIGIGPSSSHTVGPMRSARAFLQSIEPLLNKAKQVQVELYGSLALTGHGHGTDKALILGLAGYTPEGVEPAHIENILSQILSRQQIPLLGLYSIPFLPSNLVFHKDKFLPAHSNGMRFTLYDADSVQLSQQVYYSIGGGFIAQSSPNSTLSDPHLAQKKVPYPFTTATELLAQCAKQNCSIVDLMWQNEKSFKSEKEIRQGLLNLNQIMKECVQRGCNREEGFLPGGLNVRRRAPKLYQQLQELKANGDTDPAAIFDWVSLWALAVKEENASGGRVITAPTNGAAGIIPAVLHYYLNFTKNPTDEGIITYLLVCGAIGILYKENASISAAEVGCQGEVGVACSMAAAGLAAALGASNLQIENAAEIGMEHNLGLTCDPVMGLVQIPCIERNTMGAIKAINACRLALKGDGHHRVSLDQVIQTMLQTGRDMQHTYKETSLGGLAVNVPHC